MDTVLQIDNLRKHFGDTRAVDSVSLEVKRGEVFGLIGPDGAGKTTTMRLACGLMRPNEGTIRVLDYAIPEQRRKAFERLGYMPQQYSLYGDLSVQENLRFFAGMYGVSKDLRDKREKRLLDIARLDRFRDRPARALSGGMYKKLALSCALIHEPELLLLDEPTNGVDPISRRELWAFLYELVSDGVAVVVSTPYMDEAERCGRVGLLAGGKLVAVDNPTKMKENFGPTVFELETAPMLIERRKLERETDILDVYLVGRKTHVISTRGPEYKPELARLFEQNGMQVKDISVTSATFEDVFLRLTAGDGAEEDAS